MYVLASSLTNLCMQISSHVCLGSRVSWVQITPRAALLLSLEKRVVLAGGVDLFALPLPCYLVLAFALPFSSLPIPFLHNYYSLPPLGLGLSPSLPPSVVGVVTAAPTPEQEWT